MIDPGELYYIAKEYPPGLSEYSEEILELIAWYELYKLFTEYIMEVYCGIPHKYWK